MIQTFRPVQDIYPLMLSYQPVAENIFNYLNGKINEGNPCTLMIMNYHRTNYGEFRKPNIVFVYLASIINDFWDKEYLIPGLLVIVIGHELSHSVQETNMIQYTNNPTVRDFIENTNDAHAQQWLINHKDEIKRDLGIDVQYTDYTLSQIREYAERWHRTSLMEYYIHTLCDLVYRSGDYLDKFYQLFNQYSSIGMTINGCDTFIIKYQGEYVDAIPQFNEAVCAACRRHGAVIFNKITMKRYAAQIGVDTNGIILDLTTEERYYKPIEFEMSNPTYQ